MNKTKLDLSCWEILILWMYDFHSIKISQQFYFACFLFVALSFLLFLIKTYCRNIGLILSCSSSLPAHLIIIFSPLSCLFLYYLKTTEKMSLKIAKTKKKKKNESEKIKGTHISWENIHRTKKKWGKGWENNGLVSCSFWPKAKSGLESVALNFKMLQLNLASFHLFV